jgi:glycerol-3-phosphate dehydrogenase (NAD(P)+)
MNKAKIAVLGAGSWGTALANLLSNNALDVTLWGNEPEHINEIKKTGFNQAYLKDIPLSKTLSYATDLQSAVKNSAAVLIGTPSFALRDVLENTAPFVAPDMIFILACKGFEEKTGALLHDVFQQILPNNKLTVLSGPTFAKEVMMGLPTAVTIASESEKAGKQVVDWFHNDTFRPYYSADVIGVELGGAVKNILAIAAGITDGLSLGANSRAALITRGLSELINLGLALGAKKETLMGLSGIGDLVLTCTDNLSRNRQMGLLLAKGESLESAKEKIGQEVEGVRAARVTQILIKKYKVNAPIIDTVYKVLFENLPPKEAVMTLMTRQIRSE